MMLDAGFWPPARRAYIADASERYCILKDNYSYFIQQPAAVSIGYKKLVSTPVDIPLQIVKK
jgi:hypothetical protein